MSAGQEFWIVAASCTDAEKGSKLESLRSHPVLNPQAAKGALGADPEVGPFKFDIPDGSKSLSFGSFDTLVKLTDELAKADQTLDSLVHRLERQYFEIDNNAKFLIQSQGQARTLSEYLATWQWNEAKYPKSRQIQDNLQLLLSIVSKLDEEVRTKTGQFNEARTTKGNIAKKEGATLATTDLVDLLTPDKVNMKGHGNDDFFYTEHLTTICVIVPRGGAKDFEKQYESFSDMVVPKSARKFDNFDDKDGNSLWRVVVFKSDAEAFKKACREKRFTARDFEYSETAHKNLVKHRQEMEVQVATMHEKVKDLCKSAWSDVMVAWIHVKAMRVFVEGILRFGMPPQMGAFIVSPKAGATVAARKVLGEVLASKDRKAGVSADKMTEAAAEEGEEYYPYVSLSFVPFTALR
eukprot:TRINITY_DN80954_c0_g1_i1.p1 TRINITY_DN80954_c0_g1~~TRINITY_DN80954_c0_g1_i1.p1  ORF type:complete len:408 (-),score=127.78 TRINITY_DN80954_c0_g1_i1:145-1368(-)